MFKLHFFPLSPRCGRVIEEGFHYVEILSAFLEHYVCSFLLLFGDSDIAVSIIFQSYRKRDSQCVLYLEIAGDAEETSSCMEAG
jgi:hypothetical protein